MYDQRLFTGRIHNASKRLKTKPSFFAADERIRLIFDDIDLNRGDELVVYDGPSAGEMKKFKSGPGIKVGIPMYSRMQNLTVHFKKGPGNARKRGFKFEAKAVQRGSENVASHF